MRKALLTLLATLTLSVAANKSHQYTFQFSNPNSLIPAVDLHGDTYVPVTDYVFYTPDGNVSLSFVATSTGGGLGSAISTRTMDDVERHYLEMARGVQMIVKGNGVELDSLIFLEDRYAYSTGLFLNKPEGVGSVSPVERNWYSKGATGVTELQYLQNGHVPTIFGFTIFYNSPQNILKPISPLTTETRKITSLNKFVIQYDRKVKMTATPKLTLNSSKLGFISPALKAAVNEDDSTQVIVTLADGSAYEELGEYNLIINENSIISNDDDEIYNPKTVFNISIVESYAKFNMVSVTPDTVYVDEIPNKVVLTFPDILRFRDNSQQLQLVNHDGKTVRWLKAVYADDTYKTVALEFQNGQNGSVTEPGVYTISIPERFIWNNEYNPALADSGISVGARFNSSIELIYNIGHQVYASAEILKEARAWLNKKGAGYPADTCASRKILQQMVERGLGSDEKFADSIAAYIAEKNVDLPVDGKWYRIFAESADGVKVYLASRNDNILLTTDVAEAVSLKATRHADGTVTFSTIDGLYLHQLQPAEGYAGTSPRNAVNTYNASVCNLTLKHFELDGASAKAVFGLMSIYGNLGVNLNGDAKSAFALVDVTKPSVETSWEYSLRFTNKLTSAFRLEQTDKPVPVVSYSLEPSNGERIDRLQYVTVKFNLSEQVTIASDAAAQLARTNGTTIKSSSIVAVSGQSNTFRIRFDDVPAGDCVVTIPEGTFKFVDEGRTVNVQAINSSYYVYYSMDFIYDIKDIMQFYLLGVDFSNRYIRDTDLNHFVYYTDRPYTFGISSKKANLVRLASGREEIVNSGHFEPIRNFKLAGYEGCGAIRLVWDKPITEGSLETGEYLIDIFEGTFGDNNFAMYLANPESVAKYECHVNSNDFYDVLVDNEKAPVTNYDYEGEIVNGNGDVNGDGRVDITDVTLTIDYILGRIPIGFSQSAADVNADGKIDITDVTTIIDKVLQQ
ncbi:MAG: dockerin type I repeat-containing protein [Prevotella sp.]|nr:dockerin type I repeat-containing protein [Prevotella sp.]